jgi:hypothetical protein
MPLHIKETAVRIFAVFAPVAVCLAAMLNHAVSANRPVLKVVGTLMEMPRYMRILPHHIATA